MENYTEEIWKDVEGCNGYYQVSDQGRVRSPYKILTPCNMVGYHSVHLRKSTTQKTPKIHRLVANAFIPNPLGLPEINHKNGIKTCNFVWNLEWCTTQENVDHAIKMKLRDSIGSSNGRAVLTEQQVFEIRSKYVPHVYHQNMLAKEYGVSQRQIWRIIHKKQWTDI